MDHLATDPQRLELYLAARLAPEEEAAFEEHLIECGSCREEVAWAERFRGALRASAAEEIAASGVLAWLARQSRLRRGLLLAAAVLLLLLPSVLLLQRQGRLGYELAQQRAEAVRLGEQGHQLAAELVKERQRQRPTRPGPALLVSLALLRSGAPPDIRLGSDPVVLSVELPPDPAPAYQATLLDASGAVLWQQDGLRPSLYGTLLISLPPGFLPPGDYRLSLGAAGDLPFRVLPATGK
jgi:hypothetical protein